LASPSSTATRIVRPTLLALAVTAWAGVAHAAGDGAWSPLSALYDTPLLADAGTAASSSQEPATSQPATTPAEGASKGPSGAKPFIYSILLPGMGQLSMGEKGHAIPFFIAEGLIWTNYVYWQVAGNKREDDYIEQAQLNAGVGVGDGNDDYWKTVGQYSRSSGEGPNSYEEDLRRDARELYPSDPAAQDAYVVENLPTGDKAWEWRTEDLRAQYQDTRDTANDAFHKAKYSFAAALVNRVVSVIDVQLLRKKQRNESRAGELKPETRVYADALDGGGRVVVQRRF